MAKGSGKEKLQTPAKPKTGEISSEKEVFAKAKLSQDDYYQAHVGLFYKRPTTIMIMILAIIIVLDVWLRYTYFRDTTFKLFWVIAVLSIFAATIGLPLALKYQVKKFYNKTVFWEGNLKYHIMKKGIALAGKSSGERCNWERFKKIEQTKKFFLFEIDKFHIIVLPLQVLNPDEIIWIKQLIQNNATDKKTKIKLSKAA